MSKTLLLVEDDVIIAMEEARQLEKAGFTVVMAYSGKEAIEAVRKGDAGIELILMDIDLGRGMDGTEAAREILKDHDIPVVFLSSHTEKELVDKTEAITSYGYVVKNSGMTVMDASIKMAFKLFNAHRGIRAKSAELEAVNQELNSTIEEMEAANEELMWSQKVIMESEERYHVLFDNMLNGFALLEIIFDQDDVPADFRFLVVNPAFGTLTGMKTQEIRGRTGREVFPNLEDHWVERYGRVAMTGDPVNFENYSHDLDRWFAITAFSPMRGQVAVMFENVTERRRTEEALRESEKMLRRAQEISRLGHFKFNPRTNVVDGSDELFRVFGLNREEFRFPDFVGSIHPGDRDFVVATIGNSIEKGMGYDIEHRLLLRNGTLKFVRAIGEPMPDDKGATAFMVGTVQDITDRKRSEEALKGRDSLIAAISNNLPSTMIYQVIREGDGHRRFTYVSDTVRTFYGCSPEEALADSRLIYGRVMEEDLGRVIQEEEAANAALAMFKSETRMINPDGSVRWSRFISTPERLADGVTRWDGIEIDITERKRMEETLRESEERFRRVFEVSPMGMAITGPDFHFRSVNAALCGILGYGPEEFRNLTFREITHPDHLGTDEEHVRKLINGEIPVYRTDKRYIKKDGTVIWANLTLSSVRDEAGKLIHYLIQIEDITESRRVAEELHASEESMRVRDEQLRVIFETSQAGIILVDPGGKIILANQRMAEMFACSLNALIGSSYPDHVHPDHRAIGDVLMRRLILGEVDHVHVERRYIRADGTDFWGYLSGRRHVDAHGNLVSLVGMITDISERKRVEEALSLSEERFRRMVDSVTDYIYTVKFRDGKPAATSHGPACEKVTGYAPGDYEANPGLWYQMIHADDRSMVEAQAAGMLSGEGAGAIEHRIIHRDGSVRWVKNTPVLLRDAQGRPTGYDGLILDITERKKTEEELVKSAREKDVLLKELQHRVKNNLGVIKGLLSLELQKHADPQFREVFQDSMDRIQSMSEIYEQLYGSSSIDRVDLKQYVGDIARRLFGTYVIDNARIVLSLKLDDAGLDVRRTVPLGLILNELITNALKYAYPAGSGGELRVRLVNAGGVITLEVSDDGTGLTEEARSGKTSGMGFKLVELLAKQIDAGLVLEGGRGTTARITFAVDAGN